MSGEESTSVLTLSTLGSKLLTVSRIWSSIIVAVFLEKFSNTDPRISVPSKELKNL